MPPEGSELYAPEMRPSQGLPGGQVQGGWAGTGESVDTSNPLERILIAGGRDQGEAGKERAEKFKRIAKATDGYRSIAEMELGLDPNAAKSMNLGQLKGLVLRRQWANQERELALREMQIAAQQRHYDILDRKAAEDWARERNMTPQPFTTPKGNSYITYGNTLMPDLSPEERYEAMYGNRALYAEDKPERLDQRTQMALDAEYDRLKKLEADMDTLRLKGRTDATVTSMNDLLTQIKKVKDKIRRLGGALPEDLPAPGQPAPAPAAAPNVAARFRINPTTGKLERY